MAKVSVKHKSITSDEAKEAPKREPVPVGDYHAIIMNVMEGATRHENPLSKISVEFQVLFAVDEEGNQDDTHAGRRVYQDYILEEAEGMPDMNEQRRYELVMLLDGCGVEYDDDGFDTDHLKEKTVVITVRHRTGNSKDDEGNPRIYTNVVKVDSTEAVAEGDVI